MMNNRINGMIVLTLAAVLALGLGGCETTSQTGSPAEVGFNVRAEMFDPEIPLDASYNDLSEEAQQKAVVYNDEAERADQAPYPLGGWQAVHKNLKLPARPEGTAEEGAVEIEFTLSPDGDVEEVEVLAGFSEAVDAAVLDAFLRTKFQPAVKDGVPTRVRLRNSVAIAYNDY